MNQCMGTSVAEGVHYAHRKLETARTGCGVGIMATHNDNFASSKLSNRNFARYIDLIDHMKYMSDEEKILKGIKHFEQSLKILKCEN